MLAAVGFYGMLAPLLKWWPWRGFGAVFGGRALPKHIKNEQIDLTVVTPGRSLLRHTFKNCEIFGAVNVLFGECHIEHTTWARAEFLVMPNRISIPPGTIAFYGCRFLGCKFSGITAVGGEEEIRALMAIFPQGTAA
ncbi:MAG TPA: hypothetical protein VHU13_00220 [Solirubrobacteraceae bacterium]|nr:hypothetical protein [Solirubrobacteraceae bacterium]